nr:sucrose synthase 7-like [Ipomoea batatas]
MEKKAAMQRTTPVEKKAVERRRIEEDKGDGRHRCGNGNSAVPCYLSSPELKKSSADATSPNSSPHHRQTIQPRSPSPTPPSPNTTAFSIAHRRRPSCVQFGHWFNDVIAQFADFLAVESSPAAVAQFTGSPPRRRRVRPRPWDFRLYKIKQQGLNIKPQMVMVNRLILDVKGTKCNQEIEPDINTKHSYILRVPFRTENGVLDQWISRFDIYPYLERFTQGFEDRYRNFCDPDIPR